MEPDEYLDFQELRKSINIQDEALFTDYMKEVYKDLSDREESNKKKGISKISFLEYMKLPVLIGDKLFSAFDKDSDGFLTQKEFVDHFHMLYLGDYHETISIIFKLLDFDKDKIINIRDTKLLLSHLPLKNENVKELVYKFQMESLEEIDQILNKAFSNKETLNEEEFSEIVEKKNSDIYLQLLCFLYQKRPFSDQNVRMLNNFKRRTSIINNKNKNETRKVSPQTKRIRSPNKKSIFSPVDELFKINLCCENKEKNNENELTKQKSGIIEDEMKDVIRMGNKKVPINPNGDEAKNHLKNSKSIYESPTIKIFKKNRIAKNSESSNDLLSLEKMEITSDNKPEVIHEDWVYKLSETLKVKKYWLVLSGKDIYYYKNEKKEEMIGMHNLSGCFVKEEDKKTIGVDNYYSFSVKFSNKIRYYHCASREKMNRWIEELKESIGYKSFFEYYELLNDIGEGKFGIVKLGIHKKLNEKVAIKIIKKGKMSNEDIELVKGEIDIMKLCRHPNIVQLYDHFENADYIFIIMEYLKGGNLEGYLQKINFRVTEVRGAEMMKQLASGIKYLHDYGICHRDLKPDNIMLTDNSDKGSLKIMDFGLSKILGPDEKVSDGYGTLSFVAPEVLIRQPYNRMVDIWSLGVILYYMLSHTLPFDDENDNEEKIAKMTVHDDVQFLGERWSKRSEDVVDFIRECLIKDPEKRIKVEELLKHPWLKLVKG